MTDLVLAPRPVGLPSTDEARRLYDLAKRVATTDMVPGQFRGQPDQVLAAMLAGREIGLSPMEALRSFYVIDGKPAESAELLMTLALRAGHDVWVEELASDAVTVAGRRAEWPPDRPPLRVTWTLDDARQAKVTGKAVWDKYPRAMLRSRAVSELIRALCPDVTVGATYTAEELDVPVDGPHGTPGDRTPEEWTDAASEEAVVVLDAVERVPTVEELRDRIRQHGDPAVARLRWWLDDRAGSGATLDDLDDDGRVAAGIELDALEAENA